MPVTCTHPSCGMGSHVYVSNHMYCWKVSKCVDVGQVVASNVGVVQKGVVKEEWFWL